MAGQKQFQTKFIGSFFDLNQIPKGRLPEIAIAGRSNVGKSSLINRILGSKKIAKVSATPGKTRSLNYFLINDRFHIVDLPGYGYAKVSKAMRADWGILIENYFNKSKNLVGLILLLDCRREITDEDVQLIEWLAARQLPVLLTLTKADKLSKSKLNSKISQIEKEMSCDVIASSSVTGIGKKDLIDAINELVNQTKIN